MNCPKCDKSGGIQCKYCGYHVEMCKTKEHKVRWFTDIDGYRCSECHTRFKEQK